MKWFRFYSDALNDPKVQRLPGEVFKSWINILCLANQQDERGTLPPVEDIAFSLRIDEAQAQAIMDDLMRRQLVDDEDGLLVIHGWNERQKESDDVAARVHRYRQRNEEKPTKKGVTLHETLQKQKSNVVDKNRIEKKREESTSSSATPTKSEKTFSVSDAEVEELYLLYPRKQHRREALPAIERAVQRIARGDDRPHWHNGPWPPIEPVQWLRERLLLYARSPKGQAPPHGKEDFRPHPATWMNKAAYSDDEKEWSRGDSNAQPTNRTARDDASIDAKIARQQRYEQAKAASGVNGSGGRLIVQDARSALPTATGTGLHGSDDSYVDGTIVEASSALAHGAADL